MATGVWISRILYVAAKLCLADHLAGAPRTAEELAGTTGTHAPSLYRLLRALESLGVVRQDGARRFALTAMGEALRTGAPGAARASILTLAGDWLLQGWEQVLYSVETGKSGLEKALGMPVFQWLGEHPEEASLFSETMVGFHGAEPAAVTSAYDFSGYKKIVDVGGATGHLLTTVLGAYPGPDGVLFDLPHVVRDAPTLIRERGVADRVTIEAGSFFERVPKGGDAYLLSHVIHDWSDDQCLTILGNCRREMTPDSHLHVIEMLLPSDGQAHPGKMLDLMMLVGPGGKERTEQEYAALLRSADLRLTRVVPTASAVSIVEAAPIKTVH